MASTSTSCRTTTRCRRGPVPCAGCISRRRRGSPTWGQWAGAELSFENGRQLLVPAGFAHGFLTLEPDTEILYKCSDGYAPETEGAVLWNDPDIGIDWPAGPDLDPVLSDKDAAAPPLSRLDSPFAYAPLPWERAAPALRGAGR